MKRLLTLLTISLLMLASTSKAQYVNIPDVNFRNYLIQRFPTCFNGAGQMDTTSSGVLNADTIACSHGNISDLTGLEYFKNLYYLKCDYNLLTSLINLPPNLNKLYCSYNQLNFIDKLPLSLTDFECDRNNFTTLSALPYSLIYLNCNNNQLNSLPVIPSSLKAIFCNNNNLTSIPTLPNSLEQLDCSNNFITSLPALPASTLNLYCDNNPILSLPTLPSGLRLLIADNIKIKQLPILPVSLVSLSINYDTLLFPIVLPPSLGSFYCDGIALDSLPSLPTGIEYLSCRNNNLTKLPDLQNSLIDFDCSSNKLSFLPKLPETLTYLNCFDNNLYCLPILPPNLNILELDSSMIKCLPNAINNVKILEHVIVTRTNSQLNYISIKLKSMPICNPTNDPYMCQPYPQVIGKSFYDLNNNGIKDYNEPYNAYGLVFLDNGAYAFTDTAGSYQLTYDTIGNITQGVLVPPYFTANPSNQYFSTNRWDTIMVAQDIAMVPSITKDSLVINITPLMLSGRPGSDFIYHVSYYNAGTTVLSPNIVFNYDNSLLNYFSSNNPSVTDNGNSLSLTLNNFAPGRLNEFIAEFTIKKSATFGNIIKATTSITGGAAFAADSTSNVVISSFDPNDKQATAKLTPSQVVKGDRINYTIRFQNTGSASAINIVLADTLSSLLQPKTIKIINTSHPCKITMKENIMYFEFLNINLPDSFVSKDGSHGFVSFSVQPLSTVSLGTTINNKASIYFDYNKPVVSNTAQTIIANTNLPVNIVAFTASLIDHEKVLLNWVTATEINTISFNIQLSTNGKDFETIGNVRAKGKGSYQYQAPPPPKGGILYYRLQIIDKDGSSTYSEIRKLSIINYQLSIYPNPAKDFITIESNNIQQIKVVDNTGRTVINKKLETVSSITKMDVTGLTKGLYLMQVINTNGETKTEKLMIQ